MKITKNNTFPRAKTIDQKYVIISALAQVLQALNCFMTLRSVPSNQPSPLVPT